MKEGTKQIGTCAVDSGQILLIDPCYINSHWNPDTSYEAVCEVSLGDDQAGYVPTVLGTVTSTGWGDGEYPVYATYKNGRIASVTIEFMEDDDDQDEEEDGCPACCQEVPATVWSDYMDEYVCRICAMDHEDKMREEDEKDND